jgi:hypothetical protein
MNVQIGAIYLSPSLPSQPCFIARHRTHQIALRSLILLDLRCLIGGLRMPLQALVKRLCGAFYGYSVSLMAVYAIVNV